MRNQRVASKSQTRTFPWCQRRVQFQIQSFFNTFVQGLVISIWVTLLGTNTSRTSRHFWVDDFHFQRGICWFPGGYTGLKRVNSFQFLTEMTVCKSPKKKPLHVGGSWGSCWYGDMLLVIDIDIETSHQSNFFTKMHQVLYVFVIWRAGGFKDVYFLTQAGGNVQFNYNTFLCLKTNKYNSKSFRFLMTRFRAPASKYLYPRFIKVFIYSF